MHGEFHCYCHHTWILHKSAWGVVIGVKTSNSSCCPSSDAEDDRVAMALQCPHISFCGLIKGPGFFLSTANIQYISISSYRHIFQKWPSSHQSLLKEFTKGGTKVATLDGDSINNIVVLSSIVSFLDKWSLSWIPLCWWVLKPSSRTKNMIEAHKTHQKYEKLSVLPAFDHSCSVARSIFRHPLLSRHIR